MPVAPADRDINLVIYGGAPTTPTDVPEVPDVPDVPEVPDEPDVPFRPLNTTATLSPGDKLVAPPDVNVLPSKRK